MGKKDKDKGKGKKGKKGKPSVENKLQVDPEVLKELTKDLKDTFRFWNEDAYVGQFSVTAEGGIARDGIGRYFSADGHVFGGRWEQDILVEADKISYPDGCWYKGVLDSQGYTGSGHYNLPHLGILDCVFLQSRPLGPVILTDVDGHPWQGAATPGTLTLVPRNHFFDSEDALLKANSLSESRVSRRSTRNSKVSLDVRLSNDNI